MNRLVAQGDEVYCPLGLNLDSYSMSALQNDQTVLIVDDHVLVRSGLRRLVQDHPRTKRVLETSTGEQALACVASESVDLVLMDLSLPGMDGVQTSQQLLQDDPSLKIIVLTGSTLNNHIKPLFRSGIRAYLTKGCTSEEMHTAIDDVLAGRQYLSSHAALCMANLEEGDQGTPFSALSKREFEVVLLILEGKRNRQIAQKLFISEKTVSTHRQNAHEKLGVSSTTELIRLAIQHGVWKPLPIS